MKQVMLITGFLGSGKTTFLMNALKQTHCRVGVLMNEFGDISIDSATIASEHIALKELTNGSIFCSCLKDKFIDGLIELLKQDLEMIYIESSGLADPSDMDKILKLIRRNEPELSFEFGGTLCMVDGLYFERAYDKMVSVQHQIKHSHQIVINKMDLINDESYEKILRIIQEVNPRAKITIASYGNVDIHKLKANYFEIESEASTNTPTTRTKSMVITINQPIINITIKDIVNMLEEVKEYFYRIKGYVAIDDQVIKIDQVGATMDIEVFRKNERRIESKAMNQIVFLASRELASIRQISSAAKKYLRNDYKINM